MSPFIKINVEDSPGNPKVSLSLRQALRYWQSMLGLRGGEMAAEGDMRGVAKLFSMERSNIGLGDLA